MAESFDCIVVGGGHNGLVAAAYLARSGARTLVLEARDHPGGAATTEAPWPEAPEFRVTRLSYVMSLMPPTIINDLDLARHGYKIFPMGPYYQAFPEGGSIKLYADDARRNHEEVSKWSKKDADAMPRWDAWLAGLADVLGPLLLTVPPKIGSRKPADLTETLRLAWRHRGLSVRTIADVADGVVGHHIGGARLVRSGPGADHTIDRQRPLHLRGLEPVVEQVGDAHGHQPGHVGDRAH